MRMPRGFPVVGSFHDFEGTPAAEEMAARLQRMASLGADVCKIAVMPHSRRDVAGLMAACAQADDELTQPVIAIAMGSAGHGDAHMRRSDGQLPDLWHGR